MAQCGYPPTGPPPSKAKHLLAILAVIIYSGFEWDYPPHPPIALYGFPDDDNHLFRKVSSTSASEETA